MLSGLSGLSGLSAVCGGAAAGPTAPAGAVFAVVAHPSFCRSDAACTVPCAAGDAIRWWQDLVSGTWYEQPANGLRPILRYDATYGWYSEGDGASRYFEFSPSPTGYLVPISAGVRCAVYRGGTYCTAFSSYGAAITVGQSDNGSPGLINGGFAVNGAWVQYAYNVWASGDLTTSVGVAESGVAGRFWIDGVEQTTGKVTPGPGSMDKRLWLHACYDIPFCSISNIFRAALYDTALDASGRANFQTWLETPNR